jgi:hypothetical protein
MMLVVARFVNFLSLLLRSPGEELSITVSHFAPDDTSSTASSSIDNDDNSMEPTPCGTSA